MKELYFNEDELLALQNILTACLDQYEMSGGDIDYADLGEKSLRVMETLLSKIGTSRAN